MIDVTDEVRNYIDAHMTGSILGSNNVLQSGSWSSIDIEIMQYFRSLTFQEKVKALEYMITMHERTGE